MSNASLNMAKMYCQKDNCRIEIVRDGKTIQAKRELFYIGDDFWGRPAYVCLGCQGVHLLDETIDQDDQPNNYDERRGEK